MGVAYVVGTFEELLAVADGRMLVTNGTPASRETPSRSAAARGKGVEAEHDRKGRLRACVVKAKLENSV
jgi:hypothetical protein